jgi:hypothetical protein
MICTWLSERMEISLHAYQLACLSLIVKVNYKTCFLYKFLLLILTFLNRKQEITLNYRVLPKKS